MASIRLTNEVRKQITANLRKHVEESYFKSEIGKELLEAKSALLHNVKEVALAICPKSDIKVLSKHWLISKVGSLGIRKEYNEDKYSVLVNPSFSSKMFKDLEEEQIVYSYSNSGKLATAINAAGSSDFFKYLHMLHDKFTCEVDSIVTGYSNLLESYTTVGKLLADHPQLEKHIPISVFKKFAPKEPVVPKVVKLFETLEAQEELELELAEA